MFNFLWVRLPSLKVYNSPSLAKKAMVSFPILENEQGGFKVVKFADCAGLSN